MEVSIKIDSFAEPEERWQGLLQDCSVNHIFLTPQWQRSWWNTFGNGSKLLLFEVNDTSGLVGIAPLRQQERTVKFIGDTDCCDYLDFIVRRGKEVFFFQEILKYLNTLEWKNIILDSLLPNSLAINYFVPLAREKGYTVVVTQIDVSPQIILPSSWDTYLNSLDSKDRHEIRRKLRRLEKTKSVLTYTVTEKGQLIQEIESFFGLFKMSFTEKANFMDEHKRKFFRTLVDFLSDKGYLKLSFLEVGGIKTAAIICFDYGNDIYLYNSAYDPAYSALSVSLLLKVYNIKNAIENKKRRYDLLRGGETYKYDLGGQDVPVFRCVVSRS